MNWPLTEIASDGHALGLCDLCVRMPELAWVSLRRLTTVRGRLVLPIERHLHFRGEKLSTYTRDARLAGRILVQPSAGRRGALRQRRW